jgi:hypothetical protein
MSTKRRVCQKFVHFAQRLYFNEIPRFPLYAPIHLQCLSQFETLHYPWIPSPLKFPPRCLHVIFTLKREKE